MVELWRRDIDWVRSGLRPERGDRIVAKVGAIPADRSMKGVVGTGAADARMWADGEVGLDGAGGPFRESAGLAGGLGLIGRS